MRALHLILLGIATSAFASAVPAPIPMGGALVQTSRRFRWDDCGLLTDDLHIEDIQVSPDPPRPGEDLTVTVKATVDETVKEGAYAAVVVKLGLVKLLNRKYDLCKEARKANATIQCPVEPGRYTVVQIVALPREIPPVKFTVDVQGYNADDNDLFCLHMQVDFSRA